MKGRLDDSATEFSSLLYLQFFLFFNNLLTFHLVEAV